MSEYKESFDFIDLRSQLKSIREKINQRIGNVLNHGSYIMGPEVKDFESQLEKYLSVKHAVTCGNGTDALTISLMAIGVKKDDIVIVPSFTYIATAETVSQLGAKPFFVDINRQTFNMDVKSISRSIEHLKSVKKDIKALICVDLFGQQCDQKEIEAICKKHNIKMIVDAAQSFGATFNDKPNGHHGDLTTTSFFPAKPLGCYGDGGAIFTNNKDLYEKINSIRLHGKGSHKYEHINIGVNSRLDTIQAAILLEKLAIFDKEIKQRNVIAERYTEKLKDYFDCPHVKSGHKSVWAQYTIKSTHRDKLKEKLAEKNIPSVVYYPIPLHQQSIYISKECDPEGLKESEEVSNLVLSLPMHPYMSFEDQDIICDELIKAFNYI